MASDARPNKQLEYALIRRMDVPTGKSTTEGYGVKHSGANNAVENAGANEKAFAVALESKTGGTGVTCLVALLCGPCIIPVKVGTGGCTMGEYGIMAADGWTNQTLGGGTTVKYVGGWFVDTGVVGDIVGFVPSRFASGAA